MSTPGIPQSYYVTQANGQVLCQWAIASGATSYTLQRSTDGVTFTTLATPSVTSFLDTTVVLGTKYWYQVSSVRLDPITSVITNSGYTTPQTAIPVPTGEESLASMRLAAQQRADRVNSNFVTLPEWNQYINKAMFELYDLLVTIYEDLYVAAPVQFNTDGSTYLYPLPNGSNTFLNGNNPSLTVTPPAFYKLLGVDLAVNGTSNAYVTINKFNFIDRNKYLYPNTNSTQYGIFNMQYRVLGSNIEFIPTPSGNQAVRLWYIPRITELLQDTDITAVGISGWCEYIIVKAAYYALTKEESDTSSLVMQLQALNDRIIASAPNRDAGQADTISDTAGNGNNGFGFGGSFNGSSGGF